MTRRDAFQIARQADQTGDLPPTHQLAGDLRAARARLRQNAQRAAARLAFRPAPNAATVEAGLARLFGER